MFHCDVINMFLMIVINLVAVFVDDAITLAHVLFYI